jgi:hypothetical protein
MYNREFETNAEAHAQHIARLMSNAADRLKKVAALKKLKKAQKK